jgi:SAM-dependent methyltransferase
MIDITPAPAPVFVPPAMDPRLAALLAGYPPFLFNERLHQSIELLERYSIDLAIELRDRLGAARQLVAWRATPELCEMLSCQPRFAFALTWLLERLIEPGYVEAQHSNSVRRYRLRRPWVPALTELRKIGLAIDPANVRSLDLLDRAASVYPAVARGEANGEQALLGLDGIPLWLAYFHNDNPAYAVNNWLGSIAAVERLEQRRELRILEVGAGAGSASLTLLRALEERGLLPRVQRYLITEPNAFFRRRAQRELSAAYHGLPLAFQPLDINRPWAPQGLEERAFDLVFGVNVLHVAKDLLFSLHEARTVLADEGWLVLGECLRPRRGQPIYTELMFQILDGFTDVVTDPEFRPNPGFLTASQWHMAFARAGFDRIEVTPDVERIREIYPHFFTGAVCGQPAVDARR